MKTFGSTPVILMGSKASSSPNALKIFLRKIRAKEAISNYADAFALAEIYLIT